MAKKAAKKSTGTKKASPKQSTPKSAKPAESAAKNAAPLTDHEIGSAAGEVWLLLTEGKPMTLAAIKKAAKGPSDTTLMAVGWLAREGKLKFETKGRSVKLSLV